MTNLRSWTKFFTRQDKQVLDASGLGKEVGLGARPALAIVDVTYHFCGEQPEPLLQSIGKWPYSCGENAWAAIPQIQLLLEVFHKNTLPVFFSTNIGSSSGVSSELSRWTSKRELEDDKQKKGDEIIKDVAPGAGDTIIYKTKPSMFFGTPLMSYLTLLGVDTLFVCGVSTSGCVRATVVDAFSNNLHVQVVEDACFDRLEVSHAASLCDMDAKYADVVKTSQAIRAIEHLVSGGCGSFPSDTQGDAPKQTNDR